MRRFLPAYLIGILGFAASTGNTQPPASASRDDAASLFAAASRAFAAEDFEQALTGFRAAIEAGSTGPAAHYNVAVSLYRLEDYVPAEAAFRDLAEQYPEMSAVADYNLGLVRVKLGDLQTARDHFYRAAESDDPQIATLARAMLARTEQRETAPSAGDRWLGVLELAAGNDDNVALVDPLGLPAGVSSESPFGELTAYSGGPAGTSRWQLAASAFLVDYSDADDYDQLGFSLSSRYENSAGAWLFAAGPQFGQTYIDGDGFERYLGASFVLTRPILDSRAEFDIEFYFDDVDNIEARFGYIDGQRKQVAARIRQTVGTIRLTGEYRHSRDDRAGAGVSAGRHRYRLNLRRAFGALWSGDLNLEYRQSSFDRLSPVRRESRIQIGLRALRQLRSGWQFVTRYYVDDNDSSDEAYSYQRHRLSVGMSRLFR